MDSDFDVDESTWHMEAEEGEEQLEEKQKKKQWIKPIKPKVWSCMCSTIIIYMTFTILVG